MADPTAQAAPAQAHATEYLEIYNRGDRKAQKHGEYKFPHVQALDPTATAAAAAAGASLNAAGANGVTSDAQREAVRQQARAYGYNFVQREAVRDENKKSSSAVAVAMPGGEREARVSGGDKASGKASSSAKAAKKKEKKA
jgi:hypothetical protein